MVRRLFGHTPRLVTDDERCAACGGPVGSVRLTITNGGLRLIYCHSCQREVTK